MKLLSLKKGGMLVLLSVLLIVFMNIRVMWSRDYFFMAQFKPKGGDFSNEGPTNTLFVNKPSTQDEDMKPHVKNEGVQNKKESVEYERAQEAARDAKLKGETSNRKEDEHVEMLAHEQIRKKISALSPLRGFHNKTGMVAPEKWMPEFRQKSDNEYRNWREAVLAGKNTLEDPDPFPRCWVHVNHHYKFIWVKLPKTGGSSLQHHIPYGCGNSEIVPNPVNSPFCSRRAWFEERLELEDAKAWWKEYFVFSVIRNPYSRFASGYGFINRSIPKKSQPRFDEVCRDPFLQSENCVKDKSCTRSVHNVHHIQTQGSCLFSMEGGMAVDYIGLTETLDDDYQIIATEINKRLTKKNLPELNVTTSVDEANASQKFSDGYTSLFEDNPGCLDAVERHLTEELQLLGYQT